MEIKIRTVKKKMAKDLTMMNTIKIKRKMHLKERVI